MHDQQGNRQLLISRLPRKMPAAIMAREPCARQHEDRLGGRPRLDRHQGLGLGLARRDRHCAIRDTAHRAAQLLEDETAGNLDLGQRIGKEGGHLRGLEVMMQLFQARDKAPASFKATKHDGQDFH
jgi:hypothetical protein